MPRSLVLVTADCLRADHVGLLGYGRPTTPFLDALSSESLIFTDAVAAGTPTYYAFPPIMASRYPLALGREVVGIAPGEPTIATTLRDEGYATAAFIAGNPYLSERFGYEAGFDVFENDFRETENPVRSDQREAALTRWNRRISQFSRRFSPAGAVYDELYFKYCQTTDCPSLNELRRFPSADQIFDRASAWLATVPRRPFFLWLHLMDPHAPYYPHRLGLEEMDVRCSAQRARYLNAYWNRADVGPGRLRRVRNEIIDLYDAAIRWVDTQLQRFVTTLRNAGLWNDCTFALTADHGEEFMEHGGRFHAPTKLTQKLIHVPLLIRIPGKHPRRIADPCSTIHLAPSLLDALEVPIPQSFRGKSLFGEEFDFKIETPVIESLSGCTNPLRREDRRRSRLLGLRKGRYKLVIDFSTGNEQLFDLYADPNELDPLSAETAKSEHCQLLAQARSHVADSVQLRDVHSHLAARTQQIRLELANSVETVPA